MFDSWATSACWVNILQLCADDEGMCASIAGFVWKPREEKISFSSEFVFEHRQPNTIWFT